MELVRIPLKQMFKAWLLFAEEKGWELPTEVATAPSGDYTSYMQRPLILAGADLR